MKRLGEHGVPRHQEREDEHDAEYHPGPRTAGTVGDLEAEDPRTSSQASTDAPRHRAEVDVLEVRLGGLEAGAGSAVAVDPHQRPAGEELGRDHRPLLLQGGKLCLRNHPRAPDPTPKIVPTARSGSASSRIPPDR